MKRITTNTVMIKDSEAGDFRSFPAFISGTDTPSLDEAELAAYLTENGYLNDEVLADAITQALADAKASGQFDGAPGKDGETPNLQIGTVETLEAGSDATASITGTAENPLLNLGIPKGADGTGESITDEQAAQIEQNTADITDLKGDLSNFSEDTSVVEMSENLLDLDSCVLENTYITDSQSSINNKLPISNVNGYYTLKMLVNEVSTYYIYWLNSSLSSYTSFNSNAYITDENNVVLNKIGLSESGVISSCEGAKFLYITLNQFVPSVKKPMVFTQAKDKSTMVYEEYYKKNIVDINKSNIKKLTFSGCITAEYDGKKDVNIMISDNNPLNYKTLLFTGDSICFGAGDRDISNLLTQHDDMQYVAGSGITAYNNTGWAQIIAENNPKTIVYGYGVPGTCIARQQSQIDSDGYDSSILERISVMKESADYVIFHGGINDQGRKITLGSVRNSGNMSDYSTTDYDEFTFAGAVEMMIINARQKWPDAKLGFILTPKVRGREHKNCIVDGVDYRQCVYMDIIKEACEKWGVPVLDLYRCVSSYFNGDNATYYYNGDSLHPTKKTYQQEIAPKVESWLKSL